MNTPFDLLYDLDQRAKRHAAGLPSEGDYTQYWNGIGFWLMGRDYVAPMSDVQEILHIPGTVTRIPGVQPWVSGVANVRGRLLPLIDLRGFFGLPSNDIDPARQRILVLSIDGIFCGLIVDGVFGIQHFEADTYSASIPADIPESLRFCMAGSYQMEFENQPDKEFLVFSLLALAGSEQFLKVSSDKTAA